MELGIGPEVGKVALEDAKKLCSLAVVLCEIVPGSSADNLEKSLARQGECCYIV